MRKQAIVGAVLTGLVALGPQAVWADGTTSPGKNSVYVSQSGVSIVVGTVELVTGTIEKGKKKRVIEVDVTLSETTTNTSTALMVVATVNGIAMEPNATSRQLTDCQGSGHYYCTVSGHFWLDLDAAEAANPGMFINQPLVISARGGTDAGSATGGISLRAHMQKK